MRLLRIERSGEVSLTDYFYDDYHPPYATLSHTWGRDAEEVTFKDLVEGTGRSKDGYKKIEFCKKRAARDGLQFFWMDTCCIDSSSNSELSEAINSMFRWYQGATKCYVYLSDVSTSKRDANGQRAWKRAFEQSRWFTRGWTLQELLAPRSVEFFSVEGKLLGSKKSLEQQIQRITGIPIRALQGSPLSNFSVEERMLWAEKRQTKRREDKAYSLLGIFDTFMPLIYGEGEMNAIRRLHEEIRKSNGPRYKKAFRQLANPFARKEKFTPATLQEMHDRAQSYLEQDRSDEARPLFKQALAGREKILGPTHLDTARSAVGLAGVYMRLGVTFRIVVLGLFDIGRVLGELQRQMGEAMRLYEQALSSMEKQLGPTHLETLNLVNGLERAYLALNKVDEAEQLNKRVVTGFEENLEPTHPDALEAVRNLATAYMRQDRYDKVEPLARRLLAAMEEELGPTHPDTLEVVRNLATAYKRLFRYDKAEPLFRRVLAVMEEERGPMHLDTLRAVRDVASTLESQGLHDEAEPLYKRALAGMEETIGPMHWETRPTKFLSRHVI